MTDELDEILLDITPNLTSSHGDPDSYDAYDCIEYPSYQIAREKLTHRCLTCGLPECKPWYETKQAIQALIADQMAEYQAQLLKDYKEDIATAVREARIDELERQEFQDVMMLYAEYETREVVKNRIAELSNKENTNE